MAPGIVEDEHIANGSDHSTEASEANLQPKLYANVDQAQLQKKTSQFLFNYGTKFIPDIILEKVEA